MPHFHRYITILYGDEVIENWQRRYRRNFTIGIAISVMAHAVVLFSFHYMPQISGSEIQTEYINTYTAKMTMINIGEVIPGGESSGKGLDETANGGFPAQTVSGTPVPSLDSIQIPFGNETNLFDKNDSLKISIGIGGKGTGDSGIGGSGSGKGLGYGSGLGSNYTPLPFIPRQTLEVFPQNIEDVHGEIVLLLKIGTDGIVKEHKIVMNTTNDSNALKNVLEAAHKSRWEKIKMEGHQVEYWIEKTYKYN